MNWAAWGPTIVAVISAIFVAGQLTGRIRNQEITLKEHHDRLGTLDLTTANHADRLARAEAWREGYSAGSKASQ